MMFTFIAKASIIKPLVTNIDDFPNRPYQALCYYYFDFTSIGTYCGFDSIDDGGPTYDEQDGFQLLDLSHITKPIKNLQFLIDNYPELFI